MTKDNKYSFFESYHNALARVSDERYGRVVRAMSSFVFKQEEPNFTDDADWIVWELIRPILERGMEISKSRADAGANGGRKGKGVSRNKGNRNAAKDTPESNSKQKQINSKQKQINSGIGIGEGIGEEIIDSSLHSESPLSNDNVSTLMQSPRTNNAFEEWLKENCPYIAKHYTLPNEKELSKLKEKYSSEQIAETCTQIENRKDLRKRSTNLYRTLLNWLKRRDVENTPQSRAQDAVEIIAHLAEEERRGYDAAAIVAQLANEE